MSCAYSHFHLHVDRTTRQVALSGEIDAACVVAAAAAMDMLDRAGQGDITLVLDAVTFIDAAGVGAVVAAHDAQVGRGGRLGVSGASVKVRRVFDRAHRADLLQPLPPASPPSRHMHAVPAEIVDTVLTDLPVSSQTADADITAQLSDAREVIDNLQIALRTSRRIGTAVGIIMSAYHLTDREAFDVLTRLSQHTHLKLRDVAEEVVLTGQITAAPH